jgi:hypothetical protein
MAAAGGGNSRDSSDISSAGAAMAAADADDSATRPPWGGIGRVGTLALIGAVSKLYLHVLNSTSITGAEAFHKAVLERDPQQGLVTVSNHTRWIGSLSAARALHRHTMLVICSLPCGVP